MIRATATFVLCLAGLAAVVPAGAFDHYDPAALVAAARQAMRDDDRKAARVLLSRARQLAPHDARVQSAWDEYAGGQVAAKADAPVTKPEAPATKPGSEMPASKSAEPKAVAPEPPALWPVK